MTLERTNTEILVRLPLSVDMAELQYMLDYLRYKELTENTTAKQTDADKLSKEANKSMWADFKSRRQLQ